MAGRVDKVSTFKLFVKNVAPGTSPEELKSVFETVGRVVDCQIFRVTNAFVHMQDEISGRNAILTLNTRLINGKCVSVEESKNFGAQPTLSTTRIRVRNVPSSLSAKALLELFVKYGAILSVEINDTEAIVTIEAIADIRSAINDLNGYECDGQKLIVEPIVNTAITYSPKRIRPVPAAAPPSAPYYPQKYSGPPRPRPRPFRAPVPRPMLRPPPPGYYDFYPSDNGYSNGPYNEYDPDNPEGRVLRDPYGHEHSARPQYFPPRLPHGYAPRPPPQFCPPFPRHVLPRPPRPIHSNVAIEPLFFQRHGFTSDQQPENANNNNDAFYEDDPLDNFMGEPLIKPILPRARPPPHSMDFSNRSHPNPQVGFQKKFVRKGKRSQQNQPDPEEGEAYQVPGMIGPGEFRPPRKYFANLPDRPRKKKKKTEPRPQPPIPEEVHKPVPDFSSYYNEIPTGSVLRPFPPPLNPESDFSEDTDGYTF